MKKLLMITAAAISLATPAFARDVSRSGNWTVYVQGTNDDGTPVCGLRSEGTGQSVFVKWFASKPDGLSVHFFKDSWSIPEDTKITLTVRFDGDEFGTQDDAIGGMFKYNNGRQVGVVYSRVVGTSLAAKFLEEFAHANKMAVLFPGSTEQPWVLDMTGSREASEVLKMCIKQNARTQPFSTQPQASNQQPAYGDLPGPTR